MGAENATLYRNGYGGGRCRCELWHLFSYGRATDYRLGTRRREAGPHQGLARMTNAVLAVAAAQARGGLPPDPISGNGDTAISPSMAGAAIDHAIGNRNSTRGRRRLTYPRSGWTSAPVASVASRRCAQPEP